MWLGDDNPGIGPLGIRYGYTTYPDLEIVFSIPDLGRERGAEYGNYAAEWQNNPNADPSFSPIFMGLGNHDIERPTVVDYTSKVLGPNLTSALPSMENFNEGPYVTYPDQGNYADTNLTYSFDYKNAHFVMLNIYSHDILLPDGGSGTNRDRFSESYSPMGCIHDDLLAWLRADLSNTSAKHKFLFYHEGAHPVPGGRHTTDSLDHRDCFGNNDGTSARPRRDEFWSLLAEFDVEATFVGHSHHNTLVWANDLTGGYGPVYELESGFPPRLAVVQIDGDDATLRLYNTTYERPDYTHFEPFGPIKLTQDAGNYTPNLYQHYYGVDAGFPILDKTNYTFEVGQRYSTSFYFEAKDSDVEDNLTFSFNNLPDFFDVTDWSNQFRRIMVSPNTSDSANRITTSEIGTYNFDVVVSDGQQQDSMNIDLAVLPAEPPLTLGASIPNNKVINFPMHRANIYFFCYDTASGAAAPRYNGYTVKFNDVDYSCCSLWHSYSQRNVTEYLAYSQFLLPDDYDGMEDVQLGKYEVTITCSDRASNTAEPYTLTFNVVDESTQPTSTIFGSWPYDGANVEEMERMVFWAETPVARMSKSALAGITNVTKDSLPFADYTFVTSYLDGSEAWGTTDLVFDQPAASGVYDFVLNGESFTVTVGAGDACVTNEMLTGYIDQWKGGGISMATLMDRISRWKAGTGCP